MRIRETRAVIFILGGLALSKLISSPGIDGGKAFDWGKASADYAKYRDIYPEDFYEMILTSGIGHKGQRVLDLATGTGVLPRNLYAHGARFTGTDISEEQIEQARRLSREAGMEIDYLVRAAEDIDFAPDSFDAVSACQSLFYFDIDALLPRLRQVLKPGGLFGMYFLMWLPDESEIMRQTEALVLRYNPTWTGGGYRREAPAVPDWAARHGFEGHFLKAVTIPVTFTREGWNGRMKASRGVGASLSPEQVEAFGEEHLALLEKIAPPQFEIPHYAKAVVLRSTKDTAPR